MIVTVNKNNKSIEITDNSEECNENRYFLHTKMNHKFINKAIAKKSKILETKDINTFFDISNIKIVGITGTNGKTTTASIIYSILLDLGKKVALLGTRGFFVNEKQIGKKELTTPLNLDIISKILDAKNRGCEYFIMEISSHAIEQKRFDCINFALKSHTNITSDHLDYHKTLEEYIRVKNSFLTDGIRVVNKDDKNLIINNYKDLYTYSLNEIATLNTLAYSLKNGIMAILRMGKIEVDLESSLIGKYNLYNLMCAILSVYVLLNKKIELKDIVEVAYNFGGVKGRTEIISNTPLIIVDFAHTKDGMQKILESFAPRKISLVFGAGGNRDKTKRSEMGKVADTFANKIYLTSDNPRDEKEEEIIDDIASGIKNMNKITKITDRKKAIEKAIENLEDDEIMFVLGKGDETYQEKHGVKIHFSDEEVIRAVLNNKI